MAYEVAQIDTKARKRIKELEQELGVILIAYDRDSAQHLQEMSRELTESEMRDYLADPNLNKI